MLVVSEFIYLLFDEYLFEVEKINNIKKVIKPLKINNSFPIS